MRRPAIGWQVLPAHQGEHHLAASAPRQSEVAKLLFLTNLLDIGDAGRPTIGTSEDCYSIARLTLPSSNGSGHYPHSGAGQLRIQQDQLVDRRRCVRVAGELDLATTEELAAHLRGLLDRREDIVLDLSGVTFMDSTGLAAIVSAINQADAAGAKLSIASSLPAQPQRLLELTGVLERLTFTPVPPQPPA
jgi:anti-sigma B factor antagonist